MVNFPMISNPWKAVLRTRRCPGVVDGAIAGPLALPPSVKTPVARLLHMSAVRKMGKVMMSGLPESSKDVLMPKHLADASAVEK